jgi:phospholipid/cholesterol/gamma-HCH transport system permease protein
MPPACNPATPKATLGGQAMATLSPDPERPAGAERLEIAGDLTIDRAAALEQLLASTTGDRLDLDLSRVSSIDTVGAWLIHRTLRDRPGSRILGASTEVARLVEQVAAADQPCPVRPEQPPIWIQELEKAGRATIGAVISMGEGLGFVGTTLLATARSLMSPRGIRWHAVSRQIEETGINALGIIGLMSFLIGIVIAQQGAVQLEQFGAKIFTINLIGRATFRELGILLTAIMVAGRSASAFAAQIGTMKINEEIDAMRTLGLDPIAILVVPRVLALVIIMPLLGFYASVLAIIGGGLLTWTYLDIPPASFVQRLREVVPMSDFWIGMAKAPFFGAVIALTGCFQGMRVAGNAQSVGEHTTIAVVQSIFLVIVLDAFFAVFFTAIGFV